MDSRNADILQIKKYLEGKLDTRAMYELERRALDDPFLMDAMEGYETAGNQNKATVELAANLHNRLLKPKARVISLSALAMAASVIAVLTAGGWWIFSRPVVNKTAVVAQLESDKTEVAPSPLVKDPQIIINKDSLIAFNAPRRAVIRSPRLSYYNGSPSNSYDVPVTSDETAEIASSVARDNNLNEVVVVTESSRAKKDSVPFNEMVVMGYAAQRKQASAQSDPLKEQMAAASKVAPTTVVSATIKGKVVSEDGQPIPGVTIRAGNSANAAFTDKDGEYTLNLDSLNTDITYRYLGYRARTIDAKNAPSKVTLEPESSALNEVVVVGYGNAKPVDAAQPKYGWENFQKYLNANSVLPNGKTGSSKVSFTVQKDGTLSNFEINKADNDMAGQKAIQLIKNGPEWVGSPQGQPKKITVTVKFHKPEK